MADKVIIIKTLQIRFDKINGLIRIYNGTRYLTLFASDIYSASYNRISYLISLKSSIKHIFSLYYVKIKVKSYFQSQSYSYLFIEKILTSYVMILIN